MTFAWVIERGDSDGCCPIYFTGRFPPELRWSAPGDHSAAQRYALRANAERVAQMIDLVNELVILHRVCEHGWDE